MLEPWCEMGTDLRPVELVGISGQAPEELGGMLGALLFRSSQLGQEIADFLASEGFPLPEGPFRLLLMALDDPLVQNLEGGKRYRCRINLYDHLRQWLMTKIDGKAKGFLFMQLGYLLGLFYEETAPDDLSKVCREVVDYATEALGISIRVTLSHTWEGVKNISGAYRAVQDVEQGRDFYTDKLASAYTMGDTLQRLLDREQKAEFEQEFFQTANRVCGSIRAGDRKTVTRYIRDQLMKIAKNSIGLPYPTTLHLTTNRFVSLLQYSLISEDLADWRHLEHMDFSRDLAAQHIVGAAHEGTVFRGGGLIRQLCGIQADKQAFRHCFLHGRNQSCSIGRVDSDRRITLSDTLFDGSYTILGVVLFLKHLNVKTIFISMCLHGLPGIGLRVILQRLGDECEFRFVFSMCNNAESCCGQCRQY